MFADDTKIFKEISTPDDSKLLQEDSLEVSQWSKEWLLNFNPQKCKILRFGGGPVPNYFLEKGENELILGTTTEKDLGVMFRDDFSITGQFHSHNSTPDNSTPTFPLRTIPLLDNSTPYLTC